jgi:hypothetical protein
MLPRHREFRMDSGERSFQPLAGFTFASVEKEVYCEVVNSFIVY